MKIKSISGFNSIKTLILAGALSFAAGIANIPSRYSETVNPYANTQDVQRYNSLLANLAKANHSKSELMWHQCSGPINRHNLPYMPSNAAPLIEQAYPINARNTNALGSLVDLCSSETSAIRANLARIESESRDFKNYTAWKSTAIKVSAPLRYSGGVLLGLSLLGYLVEDKVKRKENQ